MQQLKVSGGFEWDSASTLQSSKRKKLKVEVKKPVTENSQELDQETGTLNIKNFNPSTSKYDEFQTADQLRRLVMTYPNSSKAWVFYMVFYLKQAELNRARSIAREALKSITYQEIDERLNIWLALINLENSYGTKESFDNVFQESLVYNENKKIYMHVLDLHVKTQKMTEALEIAEVMLNKFKKCPDVWIKILEYYMQSGKTEEARKLLERSKQVLEKRDCVDVTWKFSCFEHKYGDFELALSMFQDILDKNPKRKDLKAVYNNMRKGENVSLDPGDELISQI